jgi:hypothetical protein
MVHVVLGKSTEEHCWCTFCLYLAHILGYFVEAYLVPYGTWLRHFSRDIFLKVLVQVEADIIVTV